MHAMADHVDRNRAAWDEQAGEYVADGRRNWAGEPAWGIWSVPEADASVWCDPYRWIPEAARLLRPGGRLVFLTNHALLALCLDDDEDVPASDRLLRPYFGMHRFEWPDSDAVEFHLPHGELIALLRSSGFEVEGLTEIRPPAGATTRYGFVTLEWARRWPSEELWHARRA
jgi:SAM-dependent methyltransferase